MPDAGRERQHHRMVIVPLAAEGGARVEVAAAGTDRHRALGPLAAAPPRRA
jgi:phosphotransferase system HPr-like phosphotransfer protein